MSLCRCKRCTRVKVKCEKTVGTRQRACKKCTDLKEKCEWPETEAGAGEVKQKGKGKQKEVPVVATSPQGGEKRKWKKTAKVVVVDDEVEEVAGPSGSRSRKTLLEGLTQLVGAVGELTGEVRQMMEVHKTAAKANNRAGIALKMFLKECWFFAGLSSRRKRRRRVRKRSTRRRSTLSSRSSGRRWRRPGTMVRRPPSSPVRTFVDSECIISKCL